MVEGSGLLNRRTPKAYRKFESSRLRQLFRGSIMAVRRSPKPLVGVRFPPPEPNVINCRDVKIRKGNRQCTK